MNTTTAPTSTASADDRYLTPTHGRPGVQPPRPAADPLGLSLYGSRELRVVGRKSGQVRTTVVNLLVLDGERYLVAPRGTTEWVRNLRAAGGGELKVGRRVEAFALRGARRRRQARASCASTWEVGVRGRPLLRGHRRRLHRRGAPRHRPRLPGASAWSPPEGYGRPVFRGPYADGPPPAALEVHAPPLDRFGLDELRRMLLIGFVLVAAVLRSVAAWVVRRRGRSFATAASEGVVEGFDQLGPTFVKLGQLIASSPSLFPAPLADACLKMLDEVRPVRPGHGPPRWSRRSWACRPSEIFRSFDDTPAVGGVHRPGPRLRAARRPRRRHQAPAARHRPPHEHRPADPVLPRHQAAQPVHVRPAGQRRRHGRGPPRGHQPGAQRRPRGPPPDVASATTSARSATTPASPPPRSTGTTADRT